ncbi:MAG TPA: hypothetical protein VEP68_10005 [Anaeromyxobacteraceae bacterium]|nr:hypothetical protein [Anaeromyxobacteraceae bacterium]
MPGFPSHPADRRFYATMSVVAAAVIVTGFANTYGPKVITGAPPVPAIVHLHAVLFACWLVLFVAQTVLVMRGRVALHMRLGNAGVVLAGLMLAMGVATAIASARDGHRGIPGVEFPTPDGFLLLNVASIGVFSVLVAAGWWYRRRPQAHKRLMLAATVAGLMPPGISRLPLVSGRTEAIAALAVAFLLVGPAYDLATRRRIHPAYAGLLLAVLVVPPVVLALSGTGAWLALAGWATR